MSDLAVLAIGFGMIPIASIALVPLRTLFAAHREAAWGGLAGVLAFLGVSHGMASVLESKPFLFDGTSEFGSVGFLLIGLSSGGAMGWVLLQGSAPRTGPSRIVVAAAAFLALHSFGDGLLLGRDYAGTTLPLVRIDAISVSATAVHRLVEGALVVVPALAARWKDRSTFLVLGTSLTAIPGAFVPSFLADGFGFVEASGYTRALSAFLAAMEAVLALLILARAFLPTVIAAGGSRWIAWIAIGFVGISAVHFLVE